MIAKDTQCCISIAERPGNSGATIFNTAFGALGLDFIYKPFKVTAENLESAIKGIRAFGIRGCGVSMPHKINVLKYLDRVDPGAKEIGAVNTIVNDDGVLSGYNTDFEGAKKILELTYDVSGKKVLIVGAGGVSRAIIKALKENGAAEIYLANRTETRGKEVAKEFGINYFPYDKRNDFQGDLFINATSVGMTPLAEEMVINKEALSNYDAVMDVVAYPNKTLLLQSAEDAGKTVIPGFKMVLYQAAAQFKLYTGQNAPLEIILKTIQK